MAKKTLFETALDDIKSTDVEGLGRIREDDKGNVYKWVKDNNSTVSSAAAHAYAVYATGDRSLVTESPAASFTNVAGVFMAAISGGKYGWIHVKGKGTVLVMRTAANDTSSYDSMQSMVVLQGVSDQDYFVTTNAEAFPDEAHLAASLETIPTDGSTVSIHPCEAVLNFRL